MSSIQTMKAWAIEVKSEEGLPEVFQQTARQVIRDCGAFPYTIYAPKNTKTGKPDKDLLMMMSDKDIWLLEDHESNALVVGMGMDEVQSVQMGTVLLQSWIKICGRTLEGSECIVVHFDTVMEELFVPVLDTIRHKMLPNLSDEKEPMADELDYLKEESLKFYNYGKQALLNGQQVLNSVFEPDPIESGDHPASDQVSSPHLVILTDEELVIIQETEGAEASATQKYSGIWTHIPLRQISRVHQRLQEENQCGKVTLYFQGQKPIEILFNPTGQQRMETLVNRIETQLVGERSESN